MVSLHRFLFNPQEGLSLLKMGGVFSRNLTKDDLIEALAPIKDDIRLMKEDNRLMKDDIRLMKDSLLAPAGDAEAKKATVVIRFKKQDIIWGHGLVVQAPDHLGKEEEPKFYLISAAHVLISIAKSMSVDSGLHLSLFWLQQKHDTWAFVETERGALILHLDYVSNGSHDYGFLELKSMANEINSQRLTTDSLSLGSPEVGTSVVARGKVFLRGTVTGIIETSRFSVLAHSIPGSSGAPIFNNDRQLVGVVHGGSKHKGQAHGTGDDDAAVVYADVIEDNSLHEIVEEHLELLSKAEEVPLEVASGKVGLSRIETKRSEKGEESVEVATEETGILWELIENLDIPYKRMGELTLKKVMEALREKIKPSASKTKWNGGTDFKLVCVDDPTSNSQQAAPQGSTAIEAA